MKYFKRELLDRYGSMNDEEAEKAHNDWEEAIVKYRKYLEAIWNDLPPSVRYFNETYCFHDAKILNSDFMGYEGRYFLHIQPENDTEKILTFDIDCIDDYNVKNHYWLYEEFEITGENRFKLSVLLDDDSEMVIPFVGDIKIYELV